MKKILFTLFLAAFFGVAFYGCGEKKPDAPPIEELTPYSDPATDFELQYPANWHTIEMPGSRFTAYSQKEIIGRFRTLSLEGLPGGRIDFLVETLDDSIKTMKAFVDSPPPYQGLESSESKTIDIDGVKGNMIEYKGKLKDGMFWGKRIVATKDSQMVAIIAMETFGDAHEVYKDNFEKILASIKLPLKPFQDTTFVEVEADPPSEELRKYNGQGYSLSFPKNFNVSKGLAQNVIETKLFMGKRRGDSYIQVDVIDASESTDLKKIVDENKGKFPGAGAAQKTTLGGNDAYVFTWAPQSGVSGKVWFALKGGKLYRVTTTWFKEEKDMFYPVFEKSVGTFQIK